MPGGHPVLYGDTPISALSSEPLGARPPLRSHDPQRFAQLTHPCVLQRPGPGRGRAPRAGRGCDRRLLVLCSLHRRTFGAVPGGGFTGATADTVGVTALVRFWSGSQDPQ